MKFEKFLKSLGGHGVIYTKGDERWLASPTVLARIPENMVGVIAEKVVIMPDKLRAYIDNDINNDPSELVKAIMPIANGGIKDCIRVYADESGTIRLPIGNDEYSLISRSDITEINRVYNTGEHVFEPKALIVREYTSDPDEEPEIVGVIFPNSNFNEEDK